MYTWHVRITRNVHCMFRPTSTQFSNFTHLLRRPMMTQIVLEITLSHQLHNDQRRLALRHHSVQHHYMVARECSATHLQQVLQWFLTETIPRRNLQPVLTLLQQITRKNLMNYKGTRYRMYNSEMIQHGDHAGVSRSA